MPPVSNARRFFFAAKISRAPAVISGAITTSRKISYMVSAEATSIARFTAMIPPNALTGSHFRALA